MLDVDNHQDVILLLRRVARCVQPWPDLWISLHFQIPIMANALRPAKSGSDNIRQRLNNANWEAESGRLSMLARVFDHF